MELNSEVKKFWEEAGYTTRSHTSDNNLFVKWFASKKESRLIIAHLSDLFQNFYYLNGATYTEEEMLRVIKLKAFL